MGERATYASFLGVRSELYRAAGFHGHVDLGLAVTGLEGGQSSTFPAFGMLTAPTYDAQTSPRTERVAASELEDAEDVARRMLRHLVEATIA